MEQVIQAYNRKGAEQRIAVIRLEIDYELASLHDAILEDDRKTIKNCKKRLEQLRLELIQLEVLV